MHTHVVYMLRGTRSSLAEWNQSGAKLKLRWDENECPVFGECNLLPRKGQFAALAPIDQHFVRNGIHTPCHVILRPCSLIYHNKYKGDCRNRHNICHVHNHAQQTYYIHYLIFRRGDIFQTRGTNTTSILCSTWKV